MLAEENEREHSESLFRDYVGQSLWDIDNMCRHIFGGENDMPQYITLAHKEKPGKEMTAEEIKAHVLEKLR